MMSKDCSDSIQISRTASELLGGGVNKGCDTIHTATTVYRNEYLWRTFFRMVKKVNHNTVMENGKKFYGGTPKTVEHNAIWAYE